MKKVSTYTCIVIFGVLLVVVAKFDNKYIVQYIQDDELNTIVTKKDSLNTVLDSLNNLNIKIKVVEPF